MLSFVWLCIEFLIFLAYQYFQDEDSANHEVNEFPDNQGGPVDELQKV